MEVFSLSCTSAAFAELSKELLLLGKSLRFRARGTSMRPLVRDGDVLMVGPIEADRVQIGDVLLCCYHPERVIVHRVIRKQRTNQGFRFLVQGDKAAQADGWVLQEQVYGRLAAVERGSNLFLMNNARMKFLSWFAVIRSRWHIGYGGFSGQIINAAKKNPIFRNFFK